MLALLLVTTARAEDKIITLSFSNDETNGITWNANDCTVSGNEVTFTNGNKNKPYWTFTNAVDFKALAFVITERTADLTFELVDENGKYAYVHSFGTNAVNVIKGLSDQYDFDNNHGADLTKIKQINIDPRTEETDKYITFSSITLVAGQSAGTYDNLNQTDYEKTSLNLSAGLVQTHDNALNDDNSHASTVSGTTINAVGNDHVEEGVAKKYVNFGAGLTDLNYNVSDYDYLVVKATTTSSNFTFHVYSNDESNISYNVSPSGQPSTIIKLSDLSATTISKVTFETIAEGTLTVNEIYFLKKGTGYEITRQNTTSNNYGTICLPFAASKPTNAYVYSVKGVDSQTAPTKLYVEEVNELAAGTAYIFQSTDANDVTFTKTGTADNLTAITTQPASGLVGTFTANTDVPSGSYILSGGKWLKSNSSKVNAYRAYLTGVSDLSVVDGKSGAKAMSLDFSATTGINSVQEAQQNGGAIYSISGVRVSKPTKGIYVRNGKKFVVK